jgi:hypothetical protein
MQSLTQVVPTPAPLVCLGEFVARGELRDYMPGIPEPAPVVAEFDRAVAAAMVCAHCGLRTVSYRPFVRVRGDRVEYRGFGRCRSCGHTEAL